MGLYGRSGGNHIVADADLVLYAGSNTSDHTTANWKMPKEGTPVIQIDLDPVEIGHNYPGAIGIQSDVRAALDALAEKADAAKHDAWLTQCRSHVEAWRAEADKLRNAGEAPMQPARICKELNALLPKDAVLVADTGYAAIWTSTMMHLEHPTQTYIRAAGSLGWSFPASIGAKCAACSRPVICFCGDGGFYYHLPELETARRRNIKNVTIVNNNACLSQGLRNLNIAYQGRGEPNRKDECYVYSNTDFARIAQSLDCFGATVEKPQEFAQAFAAAMASPLPAVIDVKTEFAGQAPVAWMPG
jgi:acetolactate synthase-1/2/3 large subunit